MTEQEEPSQEVGTKLKQSESNWNSTDDTIFIRNLSYDTTQDGLKEFIEKNFGETVYCLICKDKQTGEPKGTAFVKFKKVEDLEKCMKDFADFEMQTKFHLDGRNIMVLKALKRDEVNSFKNDSIKKHKKEVKKDKRQKFKKDLIRNKEVERKKNFLRFKNHNKSKFNNTKYKDHDTDHKSNKKNPKMKSKKKPRTFRNKE